MKTSRPSLKYWIFAGLAVLLLSPATAQANAGTPLMWATTFHLLIGNLLIGVFEGYILGAVFKLPMGRCIRKLIEANYVSMWLGGLILLNIVFYFIPMDLYTLPWIYPGMILFSFIVTLLIEYPFVLSAFKDVQGRGKKAWKGTLLTQTLSYIILFGWYWMCSYTSLYTENKIVPLSEMELPKEVTIYFISTEDGNVYSGQLAEQNWQKVYDFDKKDEKTDNCLNVWPSETNTNLWDIVFCERHREGKRTIEVILKDIAQDAAPFGDSPYVDSWIQLLWKAPQIGDAKQSAWVFINGFWAAGGFLGKNEENNEKVRVSLEIPYQGKWYVRFISHLPGDRVLFQLGRDQICLYDLNKKQVALVTKGRSPLAVIGGKVPTPVEEKKKIDLGL